MNLFNAKRIADPVHGTIGLSALEAEIVSTRAFQRLRHIKHLGLAYYVFPGADYSRFSHSVGVCHITGQIFQALQDAGQIKISEEEVQNYRLAALLHDIGHYPFSHVMEDAIANHFNNGLLTKSNSSSENFPVENKITFDGPQFFRHQDLGKQVLLHDQEINGLLKNASFDPKTIYGIFTREEVLPYSNLVSSDLDADRIDYLLRTAHYTGLPYGSVDLPYLLSQMRIEERAGKQPRLCLTEKALKTADHFLLCRYFDYQQVTYHKTVAGLECVLKNVLSALIKASLIDGAAQEITSALQKEEWAWFDEIFVIQKMRQFVKMENNSVPDNLKVQAILNRVPPKLMVEYEAIKPRNESERKSFRRDRQALREKIKQWSQEFEINESLWYVWDRDVTLTKIGSHLPQSAFYEDVAEDEDGYQQGIRIFDSNHNTSKSLVEIPYSLMSVLSNQALYSLRLYLLLPSDKNQQKDKIIAKIKSDLPHMEWK